MGDTAAIALAVVLLGFNAFFVGAEFALISARRSQIEPRAQAGSRMARTTLRAMEHVSLMMDGVFGSAVPQISWSDNGGVSFNTPQAMQAKSTAAGSGILTYQQWQLGRARDRVYKVTVTTSADLVRISAADLNIEAGIEP